MLWKVGYLVQASHTSSNPLRMGIDLKNNNQLVFTVYSILQFECIIKFETHSTSDFLACSAQFVPFATPSFRLMIPLN
jgi:hypothetical protein